MKNIAYFGCSGKTTTLAQRYSGCDYLETHKYDNCKECYRYEICKNAFLKEEKGRENV